MGRIGKVGREVVKKGLIITDNHVAVDGVLKDANPNYVNVNGDKQKIHTFAESFTHHVDRHVKCHRVNRRSRNCQEQVGYFVVQVLLSLKSPK
jgi:hypothetical protein